MKITVKGTVMVKPMKETPSGSVWLSNADLLFPFYHSTSVVFYRCSSAAAGFFDPAVMKAVLSLALVDFYPFAGRLREDDNGRIEINCTSEGAAFVEAECDGAVADLGCFIPSPGVSLVPAVDYSKGIITTFPLFLVQLTRFSCGGVCLGIAYDHQIGDGTSLLHFITTWSDIARGGTAAAAPPYFDRRLLAARDPPMPLFPHIEHHPPPTLKTPPGGASPAPAATACSTFRLTPHQVDALKMRCGEPSRTTFEVVAGHVWRCATTARGLPDDQETKLQFPVDGRRRLQPPLPAGFFGNAIFVAGALASGSELASKPLRFAVEKVSEAVGRLDDEYLRSALDYMEVQPETRNGRRATGQPNLRIVSWVKLPYYEADFGWGKPVYAGPGTPPFEGKCYLSVDPENEGSLLVIITLYENHMPPFEKLFYDGI